MSPLRRVSCCMLALTLAILVAEVCCNDYDIVVNAADAGDRVKRQSISYSFFEDPLTRRATFFVQRVNTGLVMNEQGLQIVSIDANETVRYDGLARSVVTTAGDGMTETAYGNIETFTFLETTGGVMQFVPGQIFPDMAGPGTLFVEGSNALFSRSEGLNSRIISIIPLLPEIMRPPTPVEIVVTARDTAGMMNLVLNIDTPPDGNFVPSDDIIELTGAMTFLLSDRQSIFQRRRLGTSTTDLAFTNVGGGLTVFQNDRFSTLLPVTSAGVTGLELITHIAGNTILERSQQGPGVLRVGKLRGQDVAFFSNIDSVNGQITMDLVRMQLEFRVSDSTAEILTGQFPPGMAGQRLVMLNGAQSFSYPDATSISMDGTAVSVFSGSNLLQRFDTGTTPTVSAFLEHEVMRSMTAPMTFNIPAGAGATLFFNMGDNEVFVYPSRNTVIQQGIDAAQAEASITPVVTTAEYSLTSDPFGIATLRAMVQGTVGDGVDVVQVSPGTTTVDVQPGQFISYKGMTIEVLDSTGAVRETFSGVSPLTINAQGFEYLSAMNNFSMTFGGPGRLYIDADSLPGPRRAFYTGNPAIQSAITNFVNGLPEPRIEVVTDRAGDVFFQSNRQNLFNLTGAGTVMVGPDQASIYFNNQIVIVNAFDVPNNARAMYTAIDNRIRVRDPQNPGSFLFDMPAGRLIYEFVGTLNLLDPTMNHNFGFMNGFIYSGDDGAVVAETGSVNDGLNTVLTSTGGIHSNPDSIVMIPSPMLTVVDDNSIITYNGQAENRLPTGGTYYISADGNSSMYIRNTEFNARFPGIYSQLNPSRSVYNSTSGVITVTTAEGNFISSLRPGITETSSIDRNGFISYEGGEITFNPEIRGTISGVSEFVVWDGFMATMYSATNNITVSGPGIFWIEDGMAFYTADPTTVRQIRQRINNVMSTFRPPIISRTSRTFRSKFRTVMGGFPQMIEVYDGADVVLSCPVLAASPNAVTTFQRRFFNMTSGAFEFEVIMDGDNAMITRVGNTTLLTIPNIQRNDNVNAFNNTGVFRCVASNTVGRDEVTTTVNILPAQAPAILTGFLPPLDYISNTSERLITIRAGFPDNNNNIILNVDFRTVTTEGPGTASNIREDDGLTIVRTLHIGCKGEGRPKADISWYELDHNFINNPSVDLDLATMDRVFINDTERSDVVITEPREGRSVLSIDLSPTDVGCTRYVCEATNRGGTALGGVDICTQHYNCESTIAPIVCPGTCGIDIAQRMYDSCFLLTAQMMGGMQIPYEDVPQGLFPLDPELCGFDRPPCPRISFRYLIGAESECSVTCGTGSIMRNITCQQINTTDVVEITDVDETFCEGAGLYRPSEVLTCSDNPPCPRWSAGVFGECSVTCGTGGVRLRENTCLQPIHNETTFELILGEDNETIFMNVSADLCLKTIEPSRTIPCDLEERIPCPIRWRPLVWNPCPTAVGPMRGCQTRGVVCEEFLLNDYGWPGTTINDTECEDLGLPRPHTVRNCQGFICDFGIWVRGRAESVCSVTCGSGGTLMQTVECRDRNNGSILEDGYCDITQRPKEVIPCPIEFLRSRNCPGVCDSEPAFCPLVRILGCDNPNLETQAQSCCKSCPKQATPITIPPTEIVDVTVTAMPI